MKRGWDALSEEELEKFRKTGKLPPGWSAEDLERPLN